MNEYIMNGSNQIIFPVFRQKWKLIHTRFYRCWWVNKIRMSQLSNNVTILKKKFSSLFSISDLFSRLWNKRIKKCFLFSFIRSLYSPNSLTFLKKKILVSMKHSFFFLSFYFLSTFFLSSFFLLSFFFLSFFLSSFFLLSFFFLLSYFS